MKKLSLLLSLLVIFMCSLTIMPVFSIISSENSWNTLANIPTARDSLGAATIDGKVYAISGYSNGYGEITNVNEAYDPATDTWSTRNPMPTGRASFGIAVVGEKIYAIGGHSGYNQQTMESKTTCTNEAYDPLTDSWETKSPMSTNRSQLNANEVDGKIYLIGGRSSSQSPAIVALNEVYDPTTDTWTTKAPLPNPIADYASAVVGNKIYIIGGQNQTGTLDTTQIYDTVTDSWSLGAPIPTAVTQAAAGATTGLRAPEAIYVLGGLRETSSLNQVYTPNNNSWGLAAPLPSARWNIAVVALNDTLYAFGGFSDFLVFNRQTLQYTPIGYGTTVVSQSPSPNSQISTDPYSTLLLAAVIVTIIAVAAVALLLHLKRRSTPRPTLHRTHQHTRSPNISKRKLPPTLSLRLITREYLRYFLSLFSKPLVL